MATGTVTHALRKLYKAIVGQDIAKNNPTKIINDLADNWPEGITIEALSVTENDTYTAPEGKAYSPVTVNVSGGSSDFSTAEVTITQQNFNPSVGMYWPLATIISDKLIAGSYEQLTATETHTVVLYKGACETILGDVVATSGDIVVDEDGLATITGDCTITIS